MIRILIIIIILVLNIAYNKYIRGSLPTTKVSFFIFNLYNREEFIINRYLTYLTLLISNYTLKKLNSSIISSIDK